MKSITLLDPGLGPNGTSDVDNLGDIIISRSINFMLEEMFPDRPINRIPSHYIKIDLATRKIIRESEHVFVGGTNLLSSEYKILNPPLGPNKRVSSPRFRGVNKLILFGVGWGHGYGVQMDDKTKTFYREVLLDKNKVHSVRDFYSENKLRDIVPVNNTNCPTMWRLNGTSQNLKKRYSRCLFTLTDYRKNYREDDALIEYLCAKFAEVFFFPQGRWDEQYLKLLPSYSRLKSKISILSRSIDALDSFNKERNFVYIGTRLHGGIKCLQDGNPAIVVTIDERSAEISRDTNLATVKHGDEEKIDKWLNGEGIFENISLNLVGIDSFLNFYK